MGNDERPQIPDSSDPYVILGLDPSAADPRGIRRAYARLIKVFRPDRSPAEFSRIQEAFEQVMNREAPLPGFVGGEPPFVKIGTETLDSVTPTTEPREAQALHPAEYLLEDPESLRARFDTHLQDGDAQAVREILSLGSVSKRAGEDAELGAVCLRAIGGLAWRGESVQELLWTYSQGPNAAELESEIERIELEIKVSGRVRESRHSLPQSMAALLHGAPTATLERTRELRRPVHILLLEQGPEILARFDAMLADESEVVDQLSIWFAGEADWPPPALGELPDATFQEVTNLMLRGGTISRWHPSQWWRLFWYYVPLWPIAIVVSLFVYSSQRLFATYLYRRWGRHQFTEVAILAGITAEVLAEWLQVNHKIVPRYRWFLRHIEGDRALRLLGHIVWQVHPRQLDEVTM